MARDLLSNLSDYDLVYDEQDVRGHEAYAADGTSLGTIRDMLADTDAGRVVALVLDNGQQIDADLVEIGDDRVVIHTNQTLTDAQTTGTPRVYTGYEGEHLRPRVASADTYAGGTVAGLAASSDEGSLRERAEEDLRARGIIDTGHDNVVTVEGDTSGRPITTAGATGDTPSGSDASFGTATTHTAYTAARDASLGAHEPSGTDAGAYGGMNSLMGSSSNPMGSEDHHAYTEADDTYFRSYHRDIFKRDDYDAYAPAYRAGTGYGRRSDWHDRDWDVLEPDMRRDYETHYGEGAWDRFKDSVRHGFQRARNAVTGGADDNRDTPS